MAFIDTPRTDAEANLTFLNGQANGINEMSMEASFVEPKKREHNLVEQMRRKRKPSNNLRTPSARSALNELSNRRLSGARRSGEFTPLMQSVTKRNASKVLEASQTPIVGKENYRPGDAMPRILKDDLDRNVTPLAKPEFSFMTHSSNVTPSEKSILKPPDSSGYSSPMEFPARGDGAFDNGRNIMNLKEQERLVDKIEKENFGLKLKIHFLEQRLSERDPNYNETAIKENSQLKLDRVVMQKELSKIRKQLNKAEKELEALRRELLAAQTHAEREEDFQRLEDECNELQASVDQKDVELRRKEEELEKIKDELEDLRAAADSRGEDTADIRVELEAATERHAAKINEISEELGDLRDACEAKDEELAQLRAELDATGNSQADKVSDMAHELRVLEDAISSKDDELAAKDEELNNKDDELTAARKQLEQSKVSRGDALAAKDQELALKDDQIAAIHEQLDELKASQDEQLAATRAELDKRLASKDRELANMRADIQDLATSKDDEIAAARARFDRLLASKDNELVDARDNLKDLIASRSNGAAAEHSKLKELLSSKESELVDIRSSLNDLLASKDRDLADVRVSYEASLHNQKAKLAETERQVSSLEDACTSKDNEIKELKARLKTSPRSPTKTQGTEKAKLEKQLKEARADGDSERAELERLLKEARQDNDFLQDKWAKSQQFVESATAREEELCKKLHRLRVERSNANDKASAAQKELVSLQERYNEKIGEFRGKQTEWEREKARVRFVNTSMSSDEHHEKLEQLERKNKQKLEQLETKHNETYQQLKLRYKDDTAFLAREIKWLRARIEREEGFKAALIHEKTYLLRQAETYEAYNEIDLNLLEEMNARSYDRLRDERPPSKFAAAAHAVRFTIRLQRMAGQWAKQKELRPMRKAPPRTGNSSASGIQEALARQATRNVSNGGKKAPLLS